jgi:hypothetical protein
MFEMSNIFAYTSINLSCIFYDLLKFAGVVKIRGKNVSILLFSSQKLDGFGREKKIILNL